MFRQLIIIAAVISTLICHGQVSVTPQVLPQGAILKKQLWNLALSYTSNSNIYVRVRLTVTDAATGQPLFNAFTPVFMLQKGIKQLQAADVAPVTYQYNLPAVTDRAEDGYLPVGNLQACYTVILSDEINKTPLAEECTVLEVQPLSPPLLNLPADGDTVQSISPQFTWLPPAPAGIFNNLSYRITIVELMPGQNPQEAVQQNIPVYFNANCDGIFLTYPALGIPLRPGKTYAWQVTAQNNMQPSVHSEIFTFNVTSPGTYLKNKNSFAVQDAACPSGCMEGTAPSYINVFNDAADQPANGYIARDSVTFHTGFIFTSHNGATLKASIDKTLLPCDCINTQGYLRKPAVKSIARFGR